MPRAFHPLRVAAVDRLTDDAAAVTFDVPPHLAAEFRFDAGQSLTLRREVGGREHRRSYSICAPVGAPPRVGVRTVPGGLFSTWLVEEVRPSDVIEAQRPSGSFRATPEQGGRHLCVAAGSGITPMLSIAATVLRHPEARVTLVYANRRASTVMFADELADLKDRYGARLALVHVLSREPRDVELFSGRLDADRLGRIVDALVPTAGLDHAWLCGPLGLVAEARAVLADRGVPAARIHAELFHVDGPPPAPRRSEDAPPGATSAVTVVLDGRRSTDRLPRDATLLDGAQRVRADLPFACKGGVCGTCRARLVDGAADMRRNFALDPAEVAAGFVLTCQTFPVGDALTVDFDA
ncbi:1,2-phenylacetyl-CoA epoxidase subunit PaaE [Nocardioides zeae]|uniref:Phenylacetate-CoA oxygenase/reductase subunit PaaK n=1 Tax=Nocardioides zeae TaxID=1457234 RepID=A0A6P0HPF8_9ACTN|nr:1,2-phenylacetyl-CoA epoxidase subunit PaaE [Nocardioides zeae]NEN80589.1 phenylacetate-CoA oxygenase/reductase subunit PaaK [Nocardioides zeae]